MWQTNSLPYSEVEVSLAPLLDITEIATLGRLLNRFEQIALERTAVIACQ